MVSHPLSVKRFHYTADIMLNFESLTGFKKLVKRHTSTLKEMKMRHQSTQNLLCKLCPPKSCAGLGTAVKVWDREIRKAFRDGLTDRVAFLTKKQTKCSRNKPVE